MVTGKPPCWICKKPRPEWKWRYKFFFLEDTSNVFSFMINIMVIIPYIVYTLLSGLSGFSCSVLVLCVMLNTCTFACSVTWMFINTSNVELECTWKKCDVGHLLEKANEYNFLYRDDQYDTCTLELK